jgi:urease accessory protein
MTAPLPSPAAAQKLQRSDGAAEVGWRLDGATTRLAHLFQSDPCRVLFPDPAGGDPPQAAIVTTSGGLTGGDRVRIAVRAGAGTTATATTQAAEKIYRAHAGACRIDAVLDVDAGATLEWLPQETIVFDGASLERRTVADLAADARLVACEMVALGRAASGERYTRGRLFDGWRLKREGKLLWADALEIEGSPPDAAGLGDANAFAMALYAGAGAASHLDATREALPETSDLLRAGATVIGELLLVRLLGEAKTVRKELVATLERLRAQTLGLPPRMPRVWHV